MQQTEFERFIELFKALEEEQAEYVLVGGVAVNAHGIVRATEDIDLFVRPEEHNVDRVRRALRRVWDDPEIDLIRAEDLAGEYPTIRYGPPGVDFVVDILSRLGEAVLYDDLESTVMAIHGARVTVATPRTLYRMKRNTVRPIDRADALSLKEKFHLEDD